jgi:hypothetical protein
MYVILPTFVKYEALPESLQSRLPSILWSNSATDLNKFNTLVSDSSTTITSPIATANSVDDSDRRTNIVHKIDVKPTSSSPAPHRDGFQNRDIMKPDRIISQFTHHLIIALTFGMCSPPLACGVLAVIVATAMFWRGIIGKYILANTSKVTKEQMAKNTDAEYHVTGDTLDACNENIRRLEACLETCESSLDLVMYPLLWGSSIFFAFLCWDNAGDEVGWRKSIWLPLTIISGPILVSVVDVCYRRYVACGILSVGDVERGGSRQHNQISLQRIRSNMEEVGVLDATTTNGSESSVNPIEERNADDLFIS